MTDLTPKAFDNMASPTRPIRPIWTLEAIASRLGVSVDFVRDTVAKLPGSPVRQMGRRWYAMPDELEAFLRGSLSGNKP
jgi:hypothetical protein